jgi:DNA-binding MarR family transcriptional regulator
MYLYGHDSPRQEDLSEYFMLDKGTIAKTLHKLEKKEMIERLVNPGDQREKVIIVTEKGLCVRDVCTNLVQIWHEKLFMGISQEDALFLECILNKIAGNVTESLAEWETLYVNQ